MTKCLDCGALGAAPETDERGAMVCPNCGGRRLVQRKLCPKCGRDFPEQELVDGFCPGCAQKTLAQFRMLMDRFDPRERELLNTLLDGELL